MKKNTDLKVDIVVTWVDFNDPIWKKDYLKFVSDKDKNNPHVASDTRFVSQDIFKYFFRGIEQCAPWCNNVFFVTYGHVPSWLNTNNPKLHIVKHKDFIPNTYLPTFNSNAILLNIHRIKNLSEHFIFFNDDMYLLSYCKKSIFFKNELPRDMAVMNPVVAPDMDPFWDMMINNLMIINKNFSKKMVIRSHPFKWVNVRYSLKNNIRNIGLYGYKYFPGFYDCHLPNAYLKSTFYDVWEKNFQICDSTCKNKFRTSEDITEWTMRYWQLASNKFIPINKQKLGFYTTFKSSKVIDDIQKSKYMVCINDDGDYSAVDNYLNKLFPKKSSFEF